MNKGTSMNASSKAIENNITTWFKIVTIWFYTQRGQRVHYGTSLCITNGMTHEQNACVCR